MSASEFIPDGGGLKAAGIARRELYLTNVVKHFRFEERGKRRIHQTSRKGEIDACRPWLDTEIKLIRPVVAATIHPSAIVRDRDEASREAERRALASELRAVAEAAA